MLIMLLLSFVISLTSVYCINAQTDQQEPPPKCGPNSFPNWDICRNPNCDSEPCKPVVKFECKCYPGYMLDADNNCVLISECFNIRGDQAGQSAPAEHQINREERQNDNQQVMNPQLRTLNKYSRRIGNWAMVKPRKKLSRTKPLRRYQHYRRYNRIGGRLHSTGLKYGTPQKMECF